jgi:hypothetical protein
MSKATSHDRKHRLWFANTSAETQDAVLGRAGLNTIIASIQHEDSGGQEPECA